MPINMNNFIFHSSRIPFGSVKTVNISLPIGGAVSVANGRTVWSDLIPLEAKSISPKIIYTIPPGTSWYRQVGPALTAGTRLAGEGFRYGTVSGSNYRDIYVDPKIKYEANGVKVGVQMFASYSGTPVTSVTMPTVNLNMLVSFDVIPRNIQ